MLTIFVAMLKSNLPTYAIVELLIRLSGHNSVIGDYKDHAVSEDEVIVKTSGGTIKLPVALIERQFASPESITEEELARTVSRFSPMN
ncbi:MAG TPA: hypothetical protein VHB54_07245 [Mucilaginibacter sp.]|nr:hypothetical protein [Mucilaginibacter sp.]HVW13596.1 hypothetical protein [Mucilaginibacter sp.]